MTFLYVFLGAVAFVFLFKAPIKKCPWAFYAVSLALSALYIFNVGIVPLGIWHDLLFALMQRCALSLSIFAIVMYIGVLDTSTKVRSYLSPIRGELSIIAWFLAIGHMVAYLMSYLPRVLSGTGYKGNSIVIGLAIAIVMFILLAVLGVTSFNAVKRRMDAKVWKRLQMWAYAFFGLVYVHLMIFLVPAALKGGVQARVSIGIYSAVFLGYLLARIAKWGRTYHARKTSPGVREDTAK